MTEVEVRFAAADLYAPVPLDASREPAVRTAATSSGTGGGGRNQFRPWLEALETRICPVWRNGRWVTW